MSWHRIQLLAGIAVVASIVSAPHYLQAETIKLKSGAAFEGQFIGCDGTNVVLTKFADGKVYRLAQSTLDQKTLNSFNSVKFRIVGYDAYGPWIKDPAWISNRETLYQLTARWIFIENKRQSFTDQLGDKWKPNENGVLDRMSQDEVKALLAYKLELDKLSDQINQCRTIKARLEAKFQNPLPWYRRSTTATTGTR